MSDIAIIAAFTKSTLLEISKQQHALGEGLMNAAIGNDKAATPNHSAQYLLTSATYLLQLAEQCSALINTSSEQAAQQEKLLTLVDETLLNDKKQRDEFHVGDKFRFIRDRLQALSDYVKEHLAALQKSTEKVVQVLHEDDVVVYVYLFNAHGLAFTSWQKMVTPSVFYEYSVNRPIYKEKAQVEAYIRSKTSPNQHGFLAIAIPKKEILNASAGADALGSTLIKVREGVLRVEKLVAFVHNHHEYVLDKDGVLVKKTA